MLPLDNFFALGLKRDKKVGECTHFNARQSCIQKHNLQIGTDKEWLRDTHERVNM